MSLTLAVIATDSRALAVPIDGRPDHVQEDLLGDVLRIVRGGAGLTLAPPRAFLALLRGRAGSAGTVMVLGHNPGLEEFAADRLGPASGRSEEKWRGALEEKFPTAALAVLDCDIAGWEDLKRGCATLGDFLRPRDLDDQ